MFIRALAVLCVAICTVACESGGSPAAESPNAIGPSPFSSEPRDSVPSGVPTRAAEPRNVVVTLMDACDPESFNAAIGPGTCMRPGGMTFEQFIAQLTKLGFVGPWRFAPAQVNARAGQTFNAVNRGGETHTFTEVEEFGGGIVADLNELAHTPVPAPECLALSGGDFIAPGGTYEEEIEEEGIEKYQCCIHPWMRLTARVSESAHEH